MQSDPVLVRDRPHDRFEGGVNDDLPQNVIAVRNVKQSECEKVGGGREGCTADDSEFVTTYSISEGGCEGASKSHSCPTLSLLLFLLLLKSPTTTHKSRSLFICKNMLMRLTQGKEGIQTGTAIPPARQIHHRQTGWQKKTKCRSTKKGKKKKEKKGRYAPLAHDVGIVRGTQEGHPLFMKITAQNQELDKDTISTSITTNNNKAYTRKTEHWLFFLNH